MPYREKEDKLKNYYKNREKRLEYQRKYDREHKEIKSRYDKKRRTLKDYNKKKACHMFSRRVHLNELLKKYVGCQICGSKIKLEIHHKKYTKRLSDCMLLCQKCHKKLHRK